MSDQGAILKWFRNIPELDFSAHQPLKYKMPEISTRLPSYDADEENVFITAVADFIENASRKFEYQNFFNASTIEHLCWANEQLSLSDGQIKIEHANVSRKLLPNGDLISADNWFNRLALKLSDPNNPAGSCGFLLGNPGCGKSTLMKMLINRHRRTCLDKGLLFSRLEASKFFAFSHQAAIFSGVRPDSIRHLLGSLDHYYHWVVLRDILFNYCLEPKTSGQLVDRAWRFGRQKGIDEAIDRALPFVSTEKKDEIFSIVYGEIRRRSHQFRSILSLSAVQLKSLTTEFVTMVEQHIEQQLNVCVLYDGFDFFGPEETRFDHEKITTKKIILSQYSLLDPKVGDEIPSLRLAPNFRHHGMIVLRRNSFDKFVKRSDGDAFLKYTNHAEVANLPHDVVLVKALSRSLQNLSEKSKSSIDSEVSVFSLRALYDLLNYLLLRLARLDIFTDHGSSNNRMHVLNIFDGNIRHCLDLTRRLLRLLQEEAHLAGKLSTVPTFDELMKFAVSSEAIKWSRRRSYRVIEIMLFFDQPIFDNAFNVDHVSCSTALNEQRRRMTKNSFTGFFDNVFNYSHLPNDWEQDAHYLLIKIRILQVFEEFPICAEGFIREWLYCLGYDELDQSMISDALDILKFTGLISIDPFSENYYRRTNRGRVLLNVIIYDPIYLEHVFHKTLFPEVLIQEVHDYNRSYGHRNWTTSAIRNYYIFITYIRYVEQRAQCGKFKAADELKISEKMLKCIIEAVERILGEARDSNAAQAKSICKELERIHQGWLKSGIVKL